MSKPRWQARKTDVVQDRVIMARMSRSEIIVRIERVGDETKYAEWGMPKILGLTAAMDQANLQTKDEDIRE